MAPGTYDAIWKYQGECCPICLRKLVYARRKPPLDHSHALDWPRGIPCDTCNQYIGWIRDDPEAGQRLANYLIDPPAWHVIGPPPELREEKPF